MVTMTGFINVPRNGNRFVAIQRDRSASEKSQGKILLEHWAALQM
jgi:hypothetical protein